MTPAALVLLLLAQEIRFADATREAGLLDPLAGMMGHGAAAGDFDGDGRVDLFVGGFCDRPNAEYKPADGPVPCRLLRNVGGRFERVKQPDVEIFARTSGAVFADLDNDGDLELYVANNAVERARRGDEPQRSAQVRHSALFRNDGGTFVDISEESGACPPELYTARNVGVFDYDADGLLDLFICEDRLRRGKPRSVLLRNRGGLRFEVANKAAGLPDDIAGLGLAVADLNGDRRPDFLVGLSNRLFVSRGDGTYAEAARGTFEWTPVDGEDWPCGVAFGDLNRDGRLDVVIAGHHDPARVRVWLNDGELSFREVTREAGIAAPIPTKAPHVEIQDFDNDGWPDIYLSAAWVENGEIIPLVLRNDGRMRFHPPRPIRPPMVYYPAGPSGDFDGDGRIDLFLVNWFAGRYGALLRNESPKRHWVDVEVRGKTVNRMGIGARVRLSNGAVQEIATGYGYASGQRAVAHFGLGDETAVELEVVFPNGKKVTKSAGSDQLIVIEEP